MNILKWCKQPSKSISQNFPTEKWPLFLSQKVWMKAATAESEVEVNVPPRAWRLATLLLTKVIKSFSWLMATSPPPGGLGSCKCSSHPEGDGSALMTFFARRHRLGVDEPSKAFQLKAELLKSWNLTIKSFRWWGQGNSCLFMHCGFVSIRAIIGSRCFFLKITEQVATGQCGPGESRFVDSSQILIMRWTLCKEPMMLT